MYFEHFYKSEERRFVYTQNPINERERRHYRAIVFFTSCAVLCVEQPALYTMMEWTANELAWRREIALHTNHQPTQSPFFPRQRAICSKEARLYKK